MVLDITGYFTALSGLAFYPLNPGRIMDTRAGVANTGLTGAFSANVARSLAIDGHWGVPLDAGAITGNLTVTGQTAAGYVAMTPDPTDTPSTSTLNFALGDNRPTACSDRSAGPATGRPCTRPAMARRSS